MLLTRTGWNWTVRGSPKSWRSSAMTEPDHAYAGF